MYQTSGATSIGCADIGVVGNVMDGLELTCGGAGGGRPVSASTSRRVVPARLAGIVVVALASIVAVMLAAASPSPQPTRSPAADPRAAVPLAALGPISVGLGRDLGGYEIAGLRAVNPAQRLRATFSRRGALIASGSERLGLTLAGYGYLSAVRPVAPAVPALRGGRVYYSHAGMSEWWVNGPLGLEQGFTIGARPHGGSGPLTLSLALAGPTRPRLERGTVLLGSLRYAALVATDARGRALPARFAVRRGRILIELDDRGADYPVRVDPLVQQAELTASDGATRTLTFVRQARKEQTITFARLSDSKAPAPAVSAHAACSGGVCSRGQSASACLSSQIANLGRGFGSAADLAPQAQAAKFGGDVAWTPTRKIALLVAPFAYQPYFGESGYRPAVEALQREGYTVTILQNDRLTDSPAITIEKFLVDARDASVIVYFGHSGILTVVNGHPAHTGMLPLEVYRTQEAFYKQVPDLLPLIKQELVYGVPVKNEANLYFDKHFPEYGWALGLTTKGIAQMVKLDDRPFVWLTACDGAALRDGFLLAGARGFFGYNNPVLIGPGGSGTSDFKNFWDGMVTPFDAGADDPSMNTRLTTNAYDDCQASGGCQDSQMLSPGGPMTLAPAVNSIEPNPEQTQTVLPNQPFEVHVGFDARMDKSPPDDVLSVEGCGAKPAPGSKLEWFDDHALGGKFIVTGQGQLTITVDSRSAVSDEGRIELDGNDAGSDGLDSGEPRANDFVWHVQCGQLTVRGLDPTIACSKLAVGCVRGPVAPYPCQVQPDWSQFEVSGQGMDPNLPYTLSLGGTAHGVTENLPIGTITPDGSGTVSGQVFTLPDIPAHDPWTLTATPPSGGPPLTTTLETGEIDCVAMIAGGGSFQSVIAAVGLTPHSTFTETVDGLTVATIQSDANGTVPSTLVNGTCTPGPVDVQLSGYWLDHGLFTDDASDEVNQYC